MTVLLTALMAAAAALAGGPAGGGGPIRLQAAPAVRKDVPGFPRIAAPTDDAQRRINAALARLDARVGAAAKACIEGAHDGDGDYARQIDTPMRGPEFVSYVVSDDVDCGGAHPNTGHAAIVYDLRSGKPVDWTALLPPALTGKLALTTGEDDVRVVTLASPRLYALYRKGYDVGPVDEDSRECREAVDAEGADGPVPMLAWLDAKAGGLALQFDFPHAEQACSEPVVIPLEVLSREGASPRLIAALQAAHAARR